MLTDPCLLAFYFSMDGVCLFRKGKQHTLHPLLLINYNLHPEQRFQKENIICLEIIPGLKNPKDLLSFLYPMVDEFRLLAAGVPAMDASESAALRPFQLYTYICIVRVDIPVCDILLGLAGYNSRHYCNYFIIRGIYSERASHMY